MLFGPEVNQKGILLPLSTRPLSANPDLCIIDVFPMKKELVKHPNNYSRAVELKQMRSIQISFTRRAKSPWVAVPPFCLFAAGLCSFLSIVLFFFFLPPKPVGLSFRLLHIFVLYIHTYTTISLYVEHYIDSVGGFYVMTI